MAGSFASGGIEQVWHAVANPFGPEEVLPFVRAIVYDVLFGVVLFVLGMGMAIQVFGVFRGPGATPGPVKREMSQEDFDPQWGMPRRDSRLKLVLRMACSCPAAHPRLDTRLHSNHHDTKEAAMVAPNGNDHVAREEDPVLELLDNAPCDDEPVTEEDRESLRIGREESEAGLTLSAREIKRIYGYEPQPAR